MNRDGWALACAMLFPTAMAWTYFVALSGPVLPTTLPEAPLANPALQTAYALGKLLQFSFPLIYLGFFEPGALRPGRLSSRGLVFGLGFGLLVGASILLLYHGVLRTPLLDIGMAEQVRRKVAEFDAATPLRFFLLAAFLSSVHSLMEEYYWRWFVFGRLKLHVALAPAILLSSLAFMAHHVVVLHVYLPGRFLSAVVPLSLGIAVGGAVWAWLYERTGSIYAPWLSHVLVDVAIMMVGYDLLFQVHPS